MRKIVQLVAKSSGELVALCNDGSLWQAERNLGARVDDYLAVTWRRVPLNGMVDEPEMK